MRVGHDTKAQRAMLDFAMDVLADLTRAKAQTNVPHPE